MNLCRICGCKVINHNPKAAICSDQLCHLADRLKVTREEVFRIETQKPIEEDATEIIYGSDNWNTMNLDRLPFKRRLTRIVE